MKQRAMFSILTAAAVVAAVVAWKSPSAVASSHREAPGILASPQVDGTDFYMFRSYEEGRDGFVTLIADYNPLQDPYGGPNYFPLDMDAAYDIHVNNNGPDNPDGQIEEDITFRFSFIQSSTFFTLPIDGQDVAVPLSNIAPFGIGFGNMLNQNRIYSVEVIRGDVDNPTSRTLATNRGTGGNSFGVPFDNVGEKSIPNGYAAYANLFIHDLGIPGCEDGRVFVGQRKDPFAVNLGEIFDLANITDPLGNRGGERSDTEDKNVTSLHLEVPTDCLTEGGSGILGGWTTARLPRNRTLTDDPTYENPDQQSGDLVQVSRLANPLVNEVAIGLPDKNLFNAAHPGDDGANFLQYVTNPTLPFLLQTLFPGTLFAPTNIPRNDLVKVFLTGFPGLNADGSVGEVMRLNTAVPFTPFFLQNNLGVAGGDPAGFPNGRRPGDDVVDGTLRAAMGAFCFVPDPNADPTDDEFNATLLGSNVVPPVNTTRTGNCVGELFFGDLLQIVCTHNVPNVIRGSLRRGAAGEEGDEICRDAFGPTPVGFDCGLSPEEVDALLNEGTYIELNTLNNPEGEVRGQIIPPAPPTLGMCDPNDASSGLLPITDGTYVGPGQFGDAFPYLRTPIPGSPNEGMTRNADLLPDWVDNLLVPEGWGHGSLELVQGADFTFRFRFRTNLPGPNTIVITEGSADGPVAWRLDVDESGTLEETLDENDYMGPTPPVIFEDGFESGDITVWSSVVGDKAKGAAATPIIAGPFR